MESQGVGNVCEVEAKPQDVYIWANAVPTASIGLTPADAVTAILHMWNQKAHNEFIQKPSTEFELSYIGVHGVRFYIKRELDNVSIGWRDFKDATRPIEIELRYLVVPGTSYPSWDLQEVYQKYDPWGNCCFKQSDAQNPIFKKIWDDEIARRLIEECIWTETNSTRFRCVADGKDIMAQVQKWHCGATTEDRSEQIPRKHENTLKRGLEELSSVSARYVRVEKKSRIS